MALREEIRLVRALKNSFESSIVKILYEFVKALKKNTPIDRRTIETQISLLRSRRFDITKKLTEVRASSIIALNQTNIFPLLSILEERKTMFDAALKGYQYLINQSDANLLNIGRRFQDIVREMTLKELSQGFIMGQPTVFTRATMQERILAAAVPGVRTREQALEALKTFRQETTNQVLVFHESGLPKFYLRVKPYEKNRYFAYDIEDYSELVGLATTQEADWQANLEKAAEMDTRFLKFNSTGKNYKKLGDERCARIDGKIISLVDGAISESGERYPTLKQLLPGNFLIPHPGCLHHLTPYPEALA